MQNMTTIEEVQTAFEDLLPWEKEAFLDKYRPYYDDDDDEDIDIYDVMYQFTAYELLERMDEDDIVEYVIETISLSDEDIERMRKHCMEK